MVNKDGNGDGDVGGNFVTMAEFSRYVISMNTGLEKLNLAMWGSEGSTGLVASVNSLKTKSKMWDRVITLILGIIGSIVTALIIKGVA